MSADLKIPTVEEFYHYGLVAGLSLAEVWAAAPCEIAAAHRAYLERVTTAAWLGERMAREKRLKALDSYLAPKTSRELRGEELERRKAEHEAILEQLSG